MDYLLSLLPQSPHAGWFIFFNLHLVKCTILLCAILRVLTNAESFVHHNNSIKNNSITQYSPPHSTFIISVSPILQLLAKKTELFFTIGFAFSLTYKWNHTILAFGVWLLSLSKVKIHPCCLNQVCPCLSRSNVRHCQTTWFRLERPGLLSKIRRRGCGCWAGTNNWCSLQRPLAWWNSVEEPEWKRERHGLLQRYHQGAVRSNGLSFLSIRNVINEWNTQNSLIVCPHINYCDHKTSM